jgi:NAD(P)-dependent dehydrogenase (short-subunit alcohol dehydrogenase family)
MTRSLTGKVALVTGAAKGIGAGIAKAMAAAWRWSWPRAASASIKSTPVERSGSAPRRLEEFDRVA